MPIRNISYTSSADWAAISSWLSRRDAAEANVEPAVREILAQVRDNGDAALVNYTRSFDCPDFTRDALAVPTAAIADALACIPDADRAIITEAAANIRDFHQRQKQNSWITTPSPGTTLGQLVIPVDRAGLYVPGGQGGKLRSFRAY